jgi:hypothetical protein
MMGWDIHGIVDINWAGARLFPRFILTSFRSFKYTLIYDNHVGYGERKRDRVHRGDKLGARFSILFRVLRNLAFGRENGDEGGICIDDGWVDCIWTWVAGRKE